MNRIKTLTLACALLGTSGAVNAATLTDAVRQAIASNPEVQARWHQFAASREDQTGARGNYLPRIDLNAGLGRERLDEPDLPSDSFTRRGASLSLSQLLYDGFATREEVARLSYAKLTRYYELLDASENTALETTRAWLDVLRYRELLRLARENLAVHEQVYQQIEQRVRAGVGRGADLEQAAGRLALAESNVITETSNLHDVGARYLRVIGDRPPADMDAPAQFDVPTVTSIEETLKFAFQHSPAFNAALENVRAAQAQTRVSRSTYHPRVDLRASKAVGFDENGIDGRRDDEIIELVLNYNLFRGGADRARVRRDVELLEQARDLREKACRDIRQTVTIAWKDIHSLQRQLVYLDQHQLSIGKVREAYRKQFDIGQRTLLDLLDTENEYFQARRAYANALSDQAIAHARTLAGQGRLLNNLKLARDGLPSLQELGQDRLDVDPASQCPADAPEIDLADAPPAPRASARAPLAPAPAPRAAAAEPEAVRQTLTDWARAWASKDFPRYRGYYARTYRPENDQSVERWAGIRAARLSKPGPITLDLDELKIETAGADRAATEFRQSYTSVGYRDTTRKRIDWVREDGHWRIEREQVLDADGSETHSAQADAQPAQGGNRIK